MFDLTEASKSFLSLMQSINSAVTQTVGLDVLWCRAVPPEKSEDVILDEYSLLNVECPKQVRVVTNKTDYQPGACGRPGDKNAVRRAHAVQSLPRLPGVYETYQKGYTVCVVVLSAQCTVHSIYQEL